MIIDWTFNVFHHFVNGRKYKCICLPNFKMIFLQLQTLILLPILTTKMRHVHRTRVIKYWIHMPLMLLHNCLTITYSIQLQRYCLLFGHKHHHLHSPHLICLLQIILLLHSILLCWKSPQMTNDWCNFWTIRL